MRLKKYLITFMALLTIFTSFSANLLDLKADITGITPTGYTHTGTAINPSNPAYTTWFQKQSIDKITTNTGIGVCIEPWKLVGDWTGYNVSAYDNEQLSNIWYYAFVNTKQSNWDYAVGQLMVWEYFGYIPTAHSVPNYETRKAEINAAISKIKTVPSFHGERITMRVGESITLTDTNNVLSDYHGAKRENNGITFSQKDNQLTIFANQKAEETNTFHWDKIPASMVGQSFVHRKNNGQDVLTPMQNNPYSFHLTINVEKYGALNIGKVDEDGTAVPNTSFTLSYNADMSKPIGTYTTGTDGSVQIDQLLPQTIYYQEVSVPDHLILDSTIRSVTIVPNDTIRVTAQNKWKTGKIEITKKDKESGKVIISSPAAIQIYKEDGTFVKELQTVNGKTQAYTLRYGKYYYLETSTPNGYDINAEKHYFTISENGITVNSEINDVRTKVNLSIHKEDEETGTTSQGDSNVLDGAVYGLYARENIVDPADNHVIHTKNSEIARVTLKEGQASVYDQYCGQYYWKE
ncbi:MAG: hypothetical protein EOM11_06070, partial [Erysipelotrichia bacterium]|nr:hypothetical protein [Erysipelotrichia bacterium]